MNKIEKLMTELCPQGVEFKKLGELGDFENIGVDKKIVAGQKSVMLLNFMDIMKNKHITKDILSMEVTASDSKIEKCDIKKHDIFITPSSETRDEIGFTAVIDEDIPNAVYSYHIMRYRLYEKNNVTPYFISYLFESEDLRTQIFKASKGLTRFGLSAKDFAKLQIPLPPLAIQQEIVKILDKFTALEAELEAVLEAEMEARKKQYEYYRCKLLSFNELGGERERERLKVLIINEIGDVCMCKRVFKEQTATMGEIPFYKIGTFGKEPDAYISKELYEEYKRKFSFPKKGDILISASGTIGRTVIYDGRPAYFQDSNIVWIDNDEEQVLNKYLFHYYKIVQWQTDGGGTIARLYNDNLKKTRILVPPLVEQARIVSMLDRFDALVNDISIGLPAEIKMRRQQYEYYRDKLLTFEKVA